MSFAVTLIQTSPLNSLTTNNKTMEITTVHATQPFTFDKALTSFMKVEPVLRFLIAHSSKYGERFAQGKAIALPLAQYKMDGCEAHFFKVVDIRNYLKDEALVNHLEAEVITHMINVKGE